jgi:hypothetical protein
MGRLGAVKIMVPVAIVALAGCAQTRPLPELENGVEIALRRGEAWTTFTVRPPHIIGPQGTLELRQGKLSGALAGAAVNLQISQDAISGQFSSGRRSASGSTEVDIEGDGERVEASGLWNGQRVRVEVTPESLRGTISTRLGQCQYVLDKVEASGARTGISICFGLPEETRLELPSSLQKWLGRSEMVAVLLVLLAAPEITTMESGSPLL